MKSRLMMALSAGMLSLTSAACDLKEGIDPARFEVRFAADMSGAGTLANVLGDGAGSLGTLALSSIDSINVTITGVDASSTDGGSAALQLEQDALGRINLLALPVDDDEDAAAGVALAQGTVPAGTYNGVRLSYDLATATITLNEDVTVGGHTFTAGTHPLEVPSGDQNGIKVPFSSLTLTDDAANVVLTFDGSVTIRHVTATGSGKLLLVPVLRGRASEE